MSFRPNSIISLHFILILLLFKVNSAKTFVFQNVYNVPELSEAKFKITKDDTLCEKQIELLVGGYQRKELWALKVLDAWGKSQSGLLSGNLVNFGHYEQCLEVIHMADDPNDGVFYGQHCTIFFENDPEATDVSFNASTDITNMILPQVLHIELLREYMIALNLKMATSICVPSLCTAVKVTEIVNRMLAVHKMRIMAGASELYSQEILCNTVNIMEMRSIDMLAT